MNREMILALISQERNKQDEKWGFPQKNDLSLWGNILGEECGEIQKEICEVVCRGKSITDLKTEIIQTAAVCVAILEHLQFLKLPTE